MPKKFISRLNYLHELIEKRGTGTPDYCAKKLQVSKRTLFFQIGILKSLGGPIKYSKKLQTYFYTHKVKFSFGYQAIDN